MGRVCRDLFFPDKASANLLENLLDLTVCKIANSDVDAIPIARSSFIQSDVLALDGGTARKSSQPRFVEGPAI
jgi:hypothetical protein